MRLAVQHLGSLADGVVEEPLVLLGRRGVDQHQAAVLRGEDVVDRLLELLLERGAHALVHQDALRRHADLPGVEEGPERALHRRVVQVRVLPDDGRRLAAELQERRLQVLARQAADDAPHRRAAGEVDLLHERVGDESLGDGRRAGGLVDDQVQHAGGEAGLLKHRHDGPRRARAELRGLEDDGVAGRQREGHGASPEDVRGVPSQDERGS
ncbi:hypothetical protein VTK73DRAFT_5276 [Phialemonium thermophilum]|uniref:Uncharacterized protein n=1 Tax=Phialemonium thermophilum TaxID=223376 RepID=A0ABR3V361_9PEZI